MVYCVDPLADRRWKNFVERHPHSSIFHTSGWLEALHRTYRYEPVVYTTSSLRSELTKGLVSCCVLSWISGKMLVSLPFSDHCNPLLENEIGGTSMVEELCREQASGDGWYVELRPRRRF